MAPRPRKPTTLGLTLRVALVSGIASAVLLAGLVWQMLAGADPAMQPAQASGSSGSASATTALSVDGGSSGSSGNGISRSVPAPTSVPAPASVPAPIVSAPAPVTSSTS